MNLIVFFQGWGLTPKHIENIDSKDFDVFCYYEHQNLMFKEVSQIDFSKYNKKILIAFSLGVYAASLLSDSVFNSFDLKIAINGTEKPVDNKFGIAENIFKATLNNLSVSSLEKFNFRMCASKQCYESFKQIENSRSFSSISDELSFFYRLTCRKDSYKPKNWTKAIVSSNDLIFSAINQKNYWQQQNVEINEIDAPHYFFSKIDSWKNLF